MGDYVWALRANNGVLAFKIVAGPAPPPGFVVHPQDVRVIQGGNAVMTVVANTGVNGYQWQKVTPTTTNNVGTSSATLTLNNVQSSDAGTYRCVVSNLYGFGISATAVLTVVDPTTTYRSSSGLVGDSWLYQHAVCVGRWQRRPGAKHRL